METLWKMEHFLMPSKCSILFFVFKAMNKEMPCKIGVSSYGDVSSSKLVATLIDLFRTRDIQDSRYSGLEIREGSSVFLSLTHPML